MDKKRFNAYKDFIESHKKATLTQLVTYTASNNFITKKHLNHFIEMGLIKKVGGYYKLDYEMLTLWEKS